MSKRVFKLSLNYLLKIKKMPEGRYLKTILSELTNLHQTASYLKYSWLTCWKRNFLEIIKENDFLTNLAVNSTNNPKNYLPTKFGNHFRDEDLEKSKKSSALIIYQYLRLEECDKMNQKINLKLDVKRAIVKLRLLNYWDMRSTISDRNFLLLKNFF